MGCPRASLFLLTALSALLLESEGIHFLRCYFPTSLPAYPPSLDLLKKKVRHFPNVTDFGRYFTNRSLRGKPSFLCESIVSVRTLLLFGCDATPTTPPLPCSKRGSSSSSSHSLRYFFTGVSEPGQGLAWFILVGYVDSQLSVQYDSNTRRMESRAPWMEKMTEEDPQYWDKQTQLASGAEETFRMGVETVRNYYNLSKGFHTWQLMCGCELRPDGSKGGYDQYAYNGRDYISFDKETLTWTAADLPAQNTKRKWEREPAIAQYRKAYLEEECIEWLQRYLKYGKETLLRTEHPEVKVTRKAGFDDRESLVCQAYGLYPKEIELTWRKDGEVVHEDTFHRNTAPYPDGTYHAWLSISIDPKDRDQYRCHVEHASLAEPLVLAWEEPASNLGLIVGCVVAIVLLIAAVSAGYYVYLKKRQEGYKATSTSEGGSNSSSRGSDPTNPTV